MLAVLAVSFTPPLRGYLSSSRSSTPSSSTRETSPLPKMKIMIKLMEISMQKRMRAQITVSLLSSVTVVVPFTT